MTANQAVRRAQQAKTIIPAFNIPYLPMMKPVIRAIRDENAAAMVQVARLEWEKFESRSLEAVAEEYFRWRDGRCTLLHLDHVPVIDEDGESIDYLPIIERPLNAGYQSVMVDGSRLSLDENIRKTKAAADLAHSRGVAIEAELGAVAGHEAGGIGMTYEELFASRKGFTDLAEAGRFAEESGCDWLSVAAGSFHGSIASDINVRAQKKPEARLDIEHIARLRDATGGMPLVLHGGSGIRQEHILAAIENGISKINVATDIRQPYEAALREGRDTDFACEQVYEKTRWVIREFLKISGNLDLVI
jgi:ketose-bisphosphate aldolase